MDQPALAQPLSSESLKRSKMQRNHTMMAAIQMKNQKLQRRTSPKLLVMESMRCSLGSCPSGAGLPSERRCVAEGRDVWPDSQAHNSRLGRRKGGRIARLG